jgi:hypothetical protein
MTCRGLILCLLLAACRGAGPTMVQTSDAVADGAVDAGVDGTTAADLSAAPDRATSNRAEEYARAAVVFASCFPDDGINRNLAAFWDPLPPGQFWARAQTRASCLATAGGGCNALKRCFGYALTLGGPPCQNSCENSTLTVCGTAGGQTSRMTINCETVGLGCDPKAYCTDFSPTTGCDGTIPPFCTTDGRPTACKGGVVVAGGFCAKLGLTCQAGACTGSGAACPKDAPASEAETYLNGFACEGPVLHACVGGQEQAITCPFVAEGFTCQSAGGQFFCGLAGECVPDQQTGGNLAARCEGNTVLFCNAGRIDRVDCTSLGFTGCDVDPNVGHYGCVPTLAPARLP